MDRLRQLGKEACEAGALELLSSGFPDWDEGHMDQNDEDANMRSLKELAGKIGFEFPIQAYRKLLERPWWSRVWTIQEFSVASNAVFSCGWKSVEYYHLVGACILARSCEKHISSIVITENTPPLERIIALNFLTPDGQWRSAAEKMIGARQCFQGGTESMETLLRLLIRTNSVASSQLKFGATDPRDRVFGLLGMARDYEELGICPDYTKDCVVIYIETAKALISQGHIDILSLCQFRNAESELPSWVPDWRDPIREPCGGYAHDHRFSTCDAYSASVASRTVVDGHHVLAPEGARVDNLMELGTPWSFNPYSLDPIWTPAKSWLSEIELFCKQSDTLGEVIYEIPQQRIDAPWRIPTADQERSSSSRLRRATSLCLKGYQDMKEMIELQDQFKMIQSGSLQPVHIQRLQSRLNVLKERRHNCSLYSSVLTDMENLCPFISTRGYVGLVPAHARPEDIICVLLGAALPYVIRRDGSRYRLVGEAYVHGIMGGEYAKQHPKIETFELF